jgi:hypothetical protein
MKSLGLLACLGACCASIAGCAWLQRSKSQDVHASQHRSAEIIYQISPAASGSDSARDHRKLTLAIRYPHPDGLANYARAELVIASADDAEKANVVAGWFDRARVVAHEGLAGLTMDAGVEEARAMDIKASDLDALIAHLRQSSTVRAADATPSGIVMAGQCDGVALPRCTAHVNELDNLVQHVRRDGALIARATIPTEPLLIAQASAASAPAPVVPAGAVQRLPPVPAGR